LGASRPRRELRTLLTGQKMMYDESSKQYTQQTTAYDLSSVDPTYVVQAMAFFDAAGGRRYTGLVNRYQGFVDLSPLLGTPRAVLMALAPDDAASARLLRDGKPLTDETGHNSTVLRFVFPVHQAVGESKTVLPPGDERFEGLPSFGPAGLPTRN